MRLLQDGKLGSDYKSASQKIRVLTERWVEQFVFCPNCGRINIGKYPNNKPVADFYCEHCTEDYELKSKQGKTGTKIVDGAYRTMIERLQSTSNPNFFLLNYDLTNFAINDFLVIPKHFFVPEIIEQRAPLAATAQRAGWVGCNILLSRIPETGKIFFVRNKKVEPKERVLSEWKKVLFLRKEKDATKGWLLDVMRCIDKIGKKEFMLDDMYGYEPELSRLHPNNKPVKDKIRQQLQILRDNDYLQFLGAGKYRRT